MFAVAEVVAVEVQQHLDWMRPVHCRGHDDDRTVRGALVRGGVAAGIVVAAGEAVDREPLRAADGMVAGVPPAAAGVPPAVACDLQRLRGELPAGLPALDEGRDRRVSHLPLETEQGDRGGARAGLRGARSLAPAERS